MTRCLVLVCLLFSCAACNKAAEDTPKSKSTETQPPLPKQASDFKEFPHDDPAVQELESGVKFIVEKEGFKHARVAGDGQRILVHYSGWLTDGTEFDSSWRRGTPQEFQLTEDALIKGFRAALLGQKEGEVRLIYIPWKEAYGEVDRGTIPPRSDLIFRVHLGEVLDELPEPDIDSSLDR